VKLLRIQAVGVVDEKDQKKSKKLKAQGADERFFKVTFHKDGLIKGKQGGGTTDDNAADDEGANKSKKSKSKSKSPK